MPKPLTLLQLTALCFIAAGCAAQPKSGDTTQPDPQEAQVSATETPEAPTPEVATNTEVKTTSAKPAEPNKPKEAAKPDADVAKLIDSGRFAYEQENWQAASENFHKATQADPNCVECYCWLSKALRKLEQFDQSLEAARNALKRDPNSPCGLTCEANILYRQGDIEKAQANLARATELAPDSADARLLYGVVLHAAGKTNEAIAQYRAATKLDPADPLTHGNLGVALDEVGDSAGAIAAYRQAIALDPQFANAYVGLGRALWDIGQQWDALDITRKACKIDPQLAVAHTNMVEMCYQLGKAEEAWKYVYLSRNLGAEPNPDTVQSLDVTFMPDPGPAVLDWSVNEENVPDP